MVKLNRNGSVWNRSERIRQNDNWETIEQGLDRMETVVAESQSILGEAQQTNDMNEDVQQQINTLIAESGTSDAEVLQARIDAEGNEYPVLKDRLDESDAQLAQNEPLLAQTISKEEVDVFLVYGQSNARGYADNTEGDPVYKTENVTIWDGTKEIPLTNYMPTQNGGTSTGGAWVAFANEYARKTGRKAILANCAKGSQSIAELSKGADNTNYSGLVSWGSAIKNHITNSGKTVGKVVVLFNQGERDSADKTPSTQYKTALETLWTDIKKDIEADLFAIFTVGYYNDDRKIYAWSIQSIQRKFALQNSDVVIAFDDIESLSAHGMKVDSVHLNQVGYNYMGEKGADTLVKSLFTDNAFQQDEFFKRQGVINLDGSQEWKLYGGWLNGPSFQPSVTTSRATSNIIAVTVEADHLAITLADKIDYILDVNAEIKSVDGGVRQNGTAGIKPTFDRKIYQTEDAEGRTVVKLYFIADVSVRVKMATQEIDTAILGADLTGALSVTWGTGTARVSHPIVKKLSTAVSRDTVTPYIIACIGAADYSLIKSWNLSGELENSEVALEIREMIIPPSLLSSTTELTFSIIATEKTNS